jgi:hypothetical protein
VWDEKEGVDTDDDGGNTPFYCKFPLAVQKIVCEMFDFRLLAEPGLLTICISVIIGTLGFYAPFIYLPNRALETSNVTKENAALLLSGLGGL